MYGSLQQTTGKMKELAGPYRYRYLGTCYIKGQRVQATYPAVVSTPDGELIRGELYELDDFEQLISRLDEYEEYDPSSPEDSLYLRSEVTVTLDKGGAETAWVYYYNPSLRNA